MGVGVLLRAPAGGGKSDAALRLIDAGAVLVADDRVQLTMEDGKLMARAPEVLSGLLEVRGVGIVNLPVQPEAELGLVIDLVPQDQVERLPERKTVLLDDTTVPVVELDPFESSFVAKVKAAVLALREGRLYKTPGEP